MGCLPIVQRFGYASEPARPHPCGVGTEHAVIGWYLCCPGVAPTKVQAVTHCEGA